MNCEATILAAARACLGTPFVPQGRVAGSGLDCAGLILQAARAAHIFLPDVPAYSIPPAPALLLQALASLTRQHEILPAHVLLFQIGGQAQHLALASSCTHMIHAYAPAGCVVETTIGPAWHQRLLGIYALPAPSAFSSVL